MGRRIAKRINGTIVEKYLWSGRIRLLAVYDANDNLVMRFNYAYDRMPYSMEYLGQTYYLVYDQIGSLRAVVDSSGLVVKRIDYDSFGNVILDTDPSFRIPIGFAGGLYDADTGLIRFGVRDYDPTIGRWTAKDPIDFGGRDVNYYVYVWNSPLRWIDPWGWMGYKERIFIGFLWFHRIFGPLPVYIEGLGVLKPIPVIGPIIDQMLTPTTLSDPYLINGQWYYPDGVPVNEEDYCGREKNK